MNLKWLKCVIKQNIQDEFGNVFLREMGRWIYEQQNQLIEIIFY